MTDQPKKHRFRTRLSHGGRPGTHAQGFVNTGVMRGSTVLQPSIAARREAGANRLERNWTYGTAGGPTHWALEDMIAEIEGGTRCQIVSTGLAAVTVPLLAWLGAGDHCLMPDSVYGPARNFAGGLMKRCGIETTFYDPTIDGAGIAALFRPNTKVLYAESPGSHTFEVQDIPALAEVAHARGAKVLMDNTWGFYHFQPFTKGVDVSIQALTKYAGGHSDVLLGSITTNTAEDWETLRTASGQLGQYASPDDCWLTLRGLRTLGIRLKEQAESAMQVAHWLRHRSEVAQVLHPALPGAPGHDLWKRDFTGSCSLFGVELKPEFGQAAMEGAIEALDLFGIGASWGGYESLAIPTTGNLTRSAGTGTFAGPVFRIHVGLEDPEDLIADLDQALSGMRAQSR